jgi:hypothetical protein
MEARNTLDFTMISTFFRYCTKGLKFAREGVAAGDFSTTIQIINSYVIFCGIGIEANRVFRSTFNVIGELNETAIVVLGGDITLNRCYLEKNMNAGVLITDGYVHDVDCYLWNAVNDRIERSWTVGVITAAERGYRSQRGTDATQKRVYLTSRFGLDPKALAAVGDSVNIGLKYNEAVIPRIYGRNLLDPAAWVSETTTEFAGWDPNQGGYKIAHAAAGVRGMRQSVALDAAKTYVIDFYCRNVSGTPITVFQVDGVAVTAGVPFTVATTGSKVVRTYATQVGASENYIEVFQLMERLEDPSLVAKTSERLSRAPTQRGNLRMAAPPATGYWNVGERVENSAPAAAGYAGWICVVAGTPGTWKGVGLIEA